MLNLLILSYPAAMLRLTNLMLLLCCIYCCDNAEITWSNAATMLRRGSTPSCLGLVSSSITTSDLTSLWETPGGISLPKQRRHQFSTSLHCGCSKENFKYHIKKKPILFENCSLFYDKKKILNFMAHLKLLNLSCTYWRKSILHKLKLQFNIWCYIYM